MSMTRTWIITTLLLTNYSIRARSSSMLQCFRTSVDEKEEEQKEEQNEDVDEEE